MEPLAVFTTVSFTLGLIIGALGTVAVFRSSLAVLQTQVSSITGTLGGLGSKADRLQTDMNALADKLRAEMRDHFDREG